MRPWRRTERGRLGWALGLGLTACASPAAGAPDGAERETRAEVLSGQLFTRYRARFTGDESDHDLAKTLDLDLCDPRGRFEGSLLARANWDLDGRSDGGSADFFGLSDTYDHRLEAQLFHAYLDVESERFAVLRVGRQPLYATPVTAVLDGVRAELAPRGRAGLAFGAYAGWGEHTYESSPDGDRVLGGFGAVDPWAGAELRADWMHLEDLRAGVDHEDDLLGVALAQDVDGATTRTRLDARFTSLEGNGRDVRVGASHLDSARGLALQASLYKLLQTQVEQAAPLDPFSESLFELFPYYQLACSLSKDWERFTLLAGADLRRVEDADDEGTFNRDFERYYLTGTLAALLWVDVSLTGELWRAEDTDFETWGASLSRELAEGWELALGSYYSLYEYDFATARERDHVRDTTLDLRWKLDAAHRFALRYELERNDLDDYHQVRLESTWTF